MRHLVTILSRPSVVSETRITSIHVMRQPVTACPLYSLYLAGASLQGSDAFVSLHNDCSGTNTCVQVGSWFEPLLGYPINMRGDNRWLDTTTVIAAAIRNDERIVETATAISQVSSIQFNLQ
jgi:hypothetical protein